MKLVAALLLALAAPAAAQFGSGTPVPWPLGCPVPFTYVNDTDQPMGFTPCPPVVLDAQGQFVYLAACPQVYILLPPGGSWTTWWPQTTTTGPAQPGVYQVGGTLYDLGATDAALEPLGPPRVGFARPLHLCAPGEPDAPFVLAASGSTSLGFPLGCGLLFPLDFDGILYASLTEPSVFQNFAGQLDASGRTSDPVLAVPPNPALAGLGLELAFLTLDATAACGIGAVSTARSVTIVP